MAPHRMVLGLRRSRGRKGAAREEERRRREYLSNISIVMEKAMSSQNGVLMGQPQDAEGYLGHHIAVKEEPEEATAQIWETQWREFLNAVEVSSIPEASQFLQEEPAPWDDTPAFLASFEQVAKAYQWPEEEWADRLLPTLKGEAELAFSSLDAGEKEDYEKVKAAILRQDALNQEKNRQRFRCFCYHHADGPRGAYNQLQELCRRWLKVEKYSKEQILELLILEQFLTVLPPEIQSWVKQHNLESSLEAVSLAEDFVLKQWVPEIKEEQIAESQGEEGSMNLSEMEEMPSDAGQRPWLFRESEEEEETDFSDIDLFDDGDGSENTENHPQEEPGDPRVRTGENSYICSDCGEGYFSRIALEAHQRMHRGQESSLPPEVTVYICFDCGETFNSTLDLEAHQNAHTGQKPYTCEECGENFCQMLDLRNHQRTHNEETSSGSGEGISWNARRIHSGNSAAQVLHEGASKKKKMCLQCGKLCSDAWKLRRHQFVHTKKKQPLLKKIFQLRRKKHTCTNCGESFSQPLSLMKHKCAQTSKPPYKCVDCGESFSSGPSLQEHRKVHAENESLSLLPEAGRTQKSPYKCSDCGKCYVSQITLSVHRRIHTGEKPFQCTECPARFMWQPMLSRHRRKVHAWRKGAPPLERAPGEPGEGGESIARASHLRRHRLIHRGEKPHRCADCGESFMWQSSLSRHKRKVHKGRGVYQECGESLGRPARRGQNRPYVCADCGTGFRFSSCFERHKRTKKHEENTVTQKPSATPGRPYACSTCGKGFLMEKYLRVHQRIHTGEKPYQCAICGESFTWKASLDWHRKVIHKKKRSKLSEPLSKKVPVVPGKPHTCQECGRSCTSASSLMKHLRLHSGEKPYKCTDCGESFMWQTSYDNHRNKHKKKKLAAPLPHKLPGSLRKRYSCAVCTKSFTWLSQLMKHQSVCAPRPAVSLKTHSEAPEGKRRGRPLKEAPSSKGNVCPDCGKRFAKPSYLVKHQRVHTGGKPYRCSECGESFSWPVYLKLHKKRVHQGFSERPSVGSAPKAVHVGKKKLVPLLQRIPATQGEIVVCLEGPDEPPKVQNQPADVKKKKNFPCSQCDKSFVWPYSLIRHQNFHLKVKPFKCTDCGMRFFLKEYLAKHLKSHARVK